MNILYLSETMKWSGGAQQLLWMAAELRKRGHNLAIACQPGSELIPRAEAEGIPIEPLRMRQDYDVPAALAAARIIRRRGVELLHAQHSTAHAIGLMAVHWAHVRAFAVTRRVMFPLRKNLFSRLKYRSRRISGYVAVSESVRSELVRGGVPPERVETIPSVITPRAPLSREEGRRARQEFGLGDEALLVLTAANYAPFKGQDYLVRAAAEVVQELPQARFLLAGRDTEKLAPLVEQLGLSGRVFLAGFRRDVPRLLAACDLFVLPSLEEAAGTALREAMSAGAASIGTRTGGIPESVTDGETGVLVPPADSAALAQAITRLLRAPDERRRLGEAGQAFIQEHFSLPMAATKMERFYHRLVASHPS